MKKVLFLIQIILLGNCSNAPDAFTTFDIDPIKAALRDNKIENYEEFIVVSDSIIKTHLYKIDSNGNILSKDAFPWILNGAHDKFKYDSLGRLTNAIYESDVYIEYAINHVLLPRDRIVKEFWRKSGNLYSEYITKYDDDLNQILRRIKMHGRDTIKNLKFQYDKGKIIKVFNQGQLDTEFTYDGQRNLKTIKRFLTSDNYEIDYVSARTGLVDSTITQRGGKKDVIYYRYSK